MVLVKVLKLPLGPSKKLNFPPATLSNLLIGLGGVSLWGVSPRGALFLRPPP